MVDALMETLDDHVIVVVTDPAGFITYVNDQFCQISKFSREELLGKTHKVVNSGYHSAVFWVDLWKTISSGETWKGQICNRAKDRSLYWVQTTIHPICNEEGSVKQYVAFRTDITQQKDVENKLRQSQMHLQESARVAKLGAWELDLVAQKLNWSWTTKVIHEVPPDFEPELGSALEFYPEGEMRDRITQLVERAIQTGEPFDEELQIRGFCGRLKWVRSIGQAEMLDGHCIRLYGILQDIDDERKLREKSEQNASLLASIIDGATEFGMIAMDKAGMITAFNAGAERMLGYQAKEVVGQATPAIIHLPSELERRASQLTDEFGETVEGFETLVKVAYQRGSERREWTFVAKSGNHVPVSLVITPLRGALGEHIGYLGISQDLTLQKRAESDLHESDARFRKAFEHSGIGMALVSLEGRWLQVNQSLIEMLGYEEETLLGMSFKDITHPDDMDSDSLLYQEMISGKRVSGSIEKRYFDAQGEALWVRLDVSLVRGPDRSPLYFLSQIVNISEGKIFNRQIKETNERLALAVRAGGVGIWDFDVVTGTLIWDEQMFPLYGVDSKTFKGGGCDDWRGALHPEDFDEAVAKIEAAIAGTGEFDTEFRIIRADNGDVRHLRALASVERDDEGNAVRLVGTNWDVTAQVVQKQALVTMAEDAKQASQAKSQFLANMSHEIRTPINGVIGMTALLLDSPGLSSEQRMQANVIKSSGESLLALINDILDFSKVEAGKLDLEILEFDLRETLEDLNSLLAQRARDKKLALICSADAEVPDHVEGDPGRLRQILLNLAGNAIKFTEAGEVKVAVALASKDENDATLRFTVTDTGIGISEDQLRNLFNEFTQADSSTTRLYGGTGLGLAISKQLVKLMSGEIGVSSELGKGSEFWFTAKFPYREAKHKYGDEEQLKESESGASAISDSIFNDVAAERFEGRAGRILVAEDNIVNQMVVRGILEKFGLHADTVANGAEALEALSQIAYDLVLMDVQMPQMDGLEASRRIRAGESGELIKEVPIVALTAHARPEDRSECLQAGMTDYLSKPLVPKVLFRLLDRLLPQKPCPQASDFSGGIATVDKAVFDRAEFISGMMDDESLAREIAKLSLVDLRKQRDALAALFESGVKEDLIRALHSIKGVSANACCRKLNSEAERLENELRHGDEGLARGGYRELSEYLDEGMAALQRFLDE